MLQLRQFKPCRGMRQGLRPMSSMARCTGVCPKNSQWAVGFLQITLPPPQSLQPKLFGGKPLPSVASTKRAMKARPLITLHQYTNALWQSSRPLSSCDCRVAHARQTAFHDKPDQPRAWQSPCAPEDFIFLPSAARWAICINFRDTISASWSPCAVHSHTMHQRRSNTIKLLHGSCERGVGPVEIALVLADARQPSGAATHGNQSDC